MEVLRKINIVYLMMLLMKGVNLGHFDMLCGRRKSLPSSVR